jgi:hypothetical protein
MPELDYAFLCDYVRAEGGIAHVVAAGIDTVYVPDVPAGINLGMLMRITFTRNECGRPHRVEVIIRDVDGVHIARVTGTATPEWDPNLPANWRVGTFVPFNVGLPIPHYGEYSIEILLNDSHVKTINFRVLPSSSPQPEPEEA